MYCVVDEVAQAEMSLKRSPAYAPVETPTDIQHWVQVVVENLALTSSVVRSMSSRTRQIKHAVETHLGGPSPTVRMSATTTETRRDAISSVFTTHSRFHCFIVQLARSFEVTVSCSGQGRALMHAHRCELNLRLFHQQACLLASRSKTEGYLAPRNEGELHPWRAGKISLQDEWKRGPTLEFVADILRLNGRVQKSTLTLGAVLDADPLAGRRAESHGTLEGPGCPSEDHAKT